MTFLVTGKRSIPTILATLIVTAALAGCGASSDSGNSSAVNANSTSAASVALSAQSYEVAPSSSAIITIMRSGGSAGSATVGYSTVSGTAQAGTDYSTTDGTVTWQDGDTAPKTILVPVSAAGSGKAFAIALTSISGDAGFGNPASAVVDIITQTASASSSGSSGGTGSSSSGATSSSSSGATSSSSSGATSSSSSGATGSSSSGGSSSGSSSSGSGSTGSLTLSWTPPTENTNGTALTNLSGYTIYYGTTSNAMTNKISVNTVGVVDYVISGLQAGNWYFALTAVNSAGVESSASGTVEATL